MGGGGGVQTHFSDQPLGPRLIKNGFCLINHSKTLIFSIFRWGDPFQLGFWSEGWVSGEAI